MPRPPACSLPAKSCDWPDSEVCCRTSDLGLGHFPSGRLAVNRARLTSLPKNDFSETERYEIVRCLGEGGTGTV